MMQNYIFAIKVECHLNLRSRLCHIVSHITLLEDSTHRYGWIRVFVTLMMGFPLRSILLLDKPLGNLSDEVNHVRI